MIDQNRQDGTPSGIQSVTPEQARRMICVARYQHCVADHCMAWRKDYSYIKTTSPGGTRLPPPPTAPIKIENNKGYCGMVIHKGD